MCSLDAAVSTTNFPSQNSSYTCYTPSYTPNLKPLGGNDPGNSFSVQLLPPIPSDGTIATAFAKKGYFSLRMSRGNLIYKYSNLSTLIRSNLVAEYPPIELSIGNLSQPHQVDLTVYSRVAILTLTSLTTGDQTMRPIVTGPTVVQELMFTTVCVGGALVEVENYRGTLRRALFNSYSLLEERNACQLKSRRQSTSDFVRFKVAPITPSFALETVTLRTHSISFDVRIIDGRSFFWIVNGSDSLFCSSVTGLTVASMTIGRMPIFAALPKVTGEWHRMFVGLTESNSLHISIDGQTSSDFESKFANVSLDSLLDAPLHLGSPGESVGVHNGMGLTGCMANFNIQGSFPVVGPNLDALVILDELAYDTNRSQCFGCTGGPSCPAGEICEDTGSVEPSSCADATVPETAVAMNCSGET